MKYVIGHDPLNNQYYPAVFADEIIHSDIFQAMRFIHKGITLLGAAECTSTGETFGCSESLQSRPSELDSTILHLFLTEGLSGLRLANTVLLQVLNQTDYFKDI